MRHFGIVFYGIAAALLGGALIFIPFVYFFAGNFSSKPFDWQQANELLPSFIIVLLLFSLVSWRLVKTIRS